MSDLKQKQGETINFNLKPQISLSKNMFEGTKPMEGAEIKALYKAIKKQRNSSTESLL